LLSLLVRANLSEKPSQRLSDDAVLARESTSDPYSLNTALSNPTEIPIFLIAGHETTANSLAFTLFELARRPDLQNQLRDEARQFALPSGTAGNEPLDSETLDALDQLPLLDAVVRESLRVHSPIETVGRVAVQDTVIPLAQPFVDIHGVTQDSVRINKGDLLTVPILSVNRSKELWGPDAELWK
jgi:cytochrome P450